MTTLRGRHVTLRPLTPHDAEVTQGWRTGGRAQLLNRGAQTVAEQQAWIEGRPATEYNFVMMLDTGDLVGMYSLIDVDMHHRRAVAAHFLIGEPELVAPYGAGVIAAEATQLLYRLAFDELKLHRLDGTVSGDNVGMIRYDQYLGWQVEGRLRDHYFLNSHYQDAVCVGLLEADYRTVTIARLRGLARG